MNAKKRPYSTYLLLIAICSIIGLGFIHFSQETIVPDWDTATSVAQVLEFLGESQAAHKTDPNTRKLIAELRGKDIVLQGKTTGPNGKKSSFVSKYYACTSCHNIQREDPDLRSRDPEDRLAYAMENRIPFLQGTTFHGIVNRESWYNGDYVKKYGEMVEAANKDLRAAIQLCAVECAQGRPLAAWEMEAVLAYFWSLQFQLEDLGYTQQEVAKLKLMARQKELHNSLIAQIKNKYMQTSPATFGNSPPDKHKGYELEGDFKRGEALYELSCLHCHKAGGVSEYILDMSTMSFRHLKKKIPKDDHFSLYQIIRYGTYALPGHRPYMPHYPLERMSHQQVEDLRAYIEVMAY